MRWMYPTPNQHLTHFPSFVRAFAGSAFVQGSAYYADGYAGAALWLPPDSHFAEEELRALLCRSVAERERADLLAVFAQMVSYHPNEPYWYLPFVGVDPIHQGQGYGSALMEHALAPCDGDQRLAYLESTNPRNLPLYQRHGFEILGTIQAGTSPPLFPMLRKPRWGRLRIAQGFLGPYDQLPEQIKELDREGARKVIAAMAREGVREPAVRTASAPLQAPQPLFRIGLQLVAEPLCTMTTETGSEHEN
jgi:ribosomal protein S18 acetylase RimI-like enzyme